MQNHNVKISSLLRLWIPFKKRIFLFLLAFFGYFLFAISQPFFAMLMEYFVRALDGEMDDKIYLIPIAAVLIAIIRGLGSFIGNYYMGKAGALVIHSIRVDLFKSIISLPVSFFDKNKSGRLVSLFNYNIGIMSSAVTGSLTVIVREGFTVLALFGYLIYQSPKLTTIFILGGPPIMILILWISKKIKSYGSRIQESIGELNHVTTELLSSVRLIKSNARESDSLNRYADASKLTYKLGLKMQKYGSFYGPSMQVMVILVMAVVMYVVLLSRTEMDAASLIAYITAAGLLPKPIRTLSSVHPSLLQAAVAAKEVFKHMDMEKEKDLGFIDNHEIKGSLSFRNVSFFYNKDKKILRNISFDVEPGQLIAIVGRSGGGKSTLVSLINRFYLPSFGEILLDDIPITDFKLTFLRRNISIVHQQAILFNGPIKDNIAYGSIRDYSFNSIVDAAKIANAHEFISELPDGYETVIGENGIMLSGGQRQRLAIARSVLSDAKVLILDEATSSLDNESETKIQLALDNIMKNRTTVVIAHRLSTIEKADKILVLDEGTISEAGTHQELMKTNSYYSKMVLRDFSN